LDIYFRVIYNQNIESHRSIALQSRFVEFQYRTVSDTMSSSANKVSGGVKSDPFKNEMQSRVQALAMGEGIKSGMIRLSQ
jgi:Flp pilus assembly secretin CpaC